MARFQDELGEALRGLPQGWWVWHPPDGRMPWRPGDWLWGHGGRWGVIEAKQVPGGTMPLSVWTPQQRLACRAVEEAGGEYWLVVNYRRKLSSTPRGATTTLAYTGGWALERLQTSSLRTLDDALAAPPQGARRVHYLPGPGRCWSVGWLTGAL